MKRYSKRTLTAYSEQALIEAKLQSSPGSRVNVKGIRNDKLRKRTSSIFGSVGSVKAKEELDFTYLNTKEALGKMDRLIERAESAPFYDLTADYPVGYDTKDTSLTQSTYNEMLSAYGHAVSGAAVSEKREGNA